MKFSVFDRRTSDLDTILLSDLRSYQIFEIQVWHCSTKNTIFQISAQKWTIGTEQRIPLGPSLSFILSMCKWCIACKCRIQNCPIKNVHQSESFERVHAFCVCTFVNLNSFHPCFFADSRAMSYQLYRNTTLGNTLQEALDELMQVWSLLQY